MKKFIDSYREYRAAKAKSKAYKIVRSVFLLIAAVFDGTGYQYFKYYLTVKYLLETERLTVEDLFNRDIDPTHVEGKVFSTL